MSESDPLIGTELGDFLPRRVLGKGGMGVVYEADDLVLRRKVALKVLAPAVVNDPQAKARFQREIDHSTTVEHPHIVPVYAAGFERPHFYIAMRLIPGPDLASTIRNEGSLETTRALRILGQIASALHTVHQRGFVHRDIKPHNVLLWGPGTADEHAMLTDFGIAKALDESRSLTNFGIVGTPAYMAPEVWAGSPATPASDQYSSAVMAYEMLTGEHPLNHADGDWRKAHLERAPRPLTGIVPAIGQTVARAIETALAKDPARRHSDVRAFAAAAAALDAERAFRQSETVTRVLAEAQTATYAAEQLTATTALSDGTISRITEVDRTEIVRMRRRQARRALVGRRP